MKKIIITLLCLSLFSCDPPKGEQADIAEAREVQQPKAEAEAISYTLLPSESELRWIGTKPTGKHIKVVNDTIIGGKITMDMDDIEVIDLRSDEDSHMKLTEHLKSQDFFNVENHPYSIFEITDIRPFEESDNAYNQIRSTEIYDIDPTHKLTGNLTMRDTTLSITFPAFIQLNEQNISAKAEFIIDRTLWNVRYHEEAEFTNKAQDQLIFDDVVVGFDIVAQNNKVIQ